LHANLIKRRIKRVSDPKRRVEREPDLNANLI